MTPNASVARGDRLWRTLDDLQCVVAGVVTVTAEDGGWWRGRLHKAAASARRILDAEQAKPGADRTPLADSFAEGRTAGVAWATRLCKTQLDSEGEEARDPAYRVAKRGFNAGVNACLAALASARDGYPVGPPLEAHAIDVIECERAAKELLDMDPAGAEEAAAHSSSAAPSDVDRPDWCLHCKTEADTRGVYRCTQHGLKP